MQALLSTRKPFRQQHFLKRIIPLLALVISLGTSQTAMAQRYTSTNLTVSASPAGGAPTSTTYRGFTANPKISGADLGNGAEFNQAAGPGQGSLVITAASTTANDGGTRITSSAIYYRVYLQGAGIAPAFSRAFLNEAGTNGSIITHTATTSIDLLNQPSVLGGGTYTVEVYFRGEYDDAGTTGAFSDPASSNSIPPVGYKASFMVKTPLTTPSGGSSTWISTAPATGQPATAAGVGSGNTDWTNPGNWSNGVPTATSDAVIPDRSTGVFRVYPILDNPTYNFAVRNLTLVGQSNSSRGEITIEQATLRVYGNLRQNAGGLRGTVTLAPGVRNSLLNSTLVLAGADQIITGRLGVSDVIIAGSGIKSVTGELSASNTLSFQPASPANGVIVQSAYEDQTNGSVGPIFDTTLLTLINLGSSGKINQEPGFAETNASYVRGVLRADHAVNTGVMEIFGNIGLDINANYTSPQNLIVFRIVDDPLQSPTSTNGKVAVPIKRQYLVDNALDSENPSFSGATLSVVFHYLDSDSELNGIPEDNLLMFRSRSNGPPYAPVYGTLNTLNNTVARPGLSSLTRFTLTLGDRANPLPVRLTAFDAKRMGADVLVTWQTASEENSKGYDVQVSTDGKVFRMLASVPSANPNTMKLNSYSYLDTEKNKAGTRYYRLRQVDLDGKETFFAPVSVSFDGKVAETTLVAYPNPFNGFDKLHVALTSIAGGKGHLRITDMTGRTIRQESVELNSGLTDLSVNGLADLKAGIYIVNLTLPTGEVKNLKIVKQ
ncbi:T9SS type A sorting domain-containing protein [Hymenobacter sedentarius]|nr:T9SS type A sorting domain-containing protein [Hymenobacter sedentarius]